MEVTRKSKRLLRLQNWLFTLLLLGVIGLSAWLSTRYVIQADWTAGNRNTLAEDSRDLLGTLDAPLHITAYAHEDPGLRRHISDLVGRYQRYKSDIEFEFVNPDAEPEKVRQLGITVDGELVLEYHGRSDKVQQLTEEQISNAILRIARQGDRWIVFLAGHGERDPLGQANFDMGDFGAALQRKGLKVQTLNLGTNPKIPDNTHVLVIASPQVSLLPGEVSIIRDYIGNGGNLLWMTEPGELNGLDQLADDLGIDFLPGVIVDATTQLFGIQQPDFALVAEYPRHPVTESMQTLTLFPHTLAMDYHEAGGWQATALLSTLDRSWTETGPLADEIRFDEDSDERAGPLDLAYALTRPRITESEDESEAGSQRVLVIGDGDFLSNTYLGNGGNLDLGTNIIDWLSNDDALISIRPKSAPDQNLDLSPRAQAIVGFGFLLVLPLLLIGIGIAVWIRRRKR